MADETQLEPRRDLPPVRSVTIDGEDRHVVVPQELHAALGIATPWRDWLRRRTREYDLIRGHDFLASPREGARGVSTAEVLLTFVGAKALAMVERTDVGRAVHAHLHECEEEIRRRSDEASATQRARLRAEVDALRMAADAGAGSSPAEVLARVLDLDGVTVGLLHKVLVVLGAASVRHPEAVMDDATSREVASAETRDREHTLPLPSQDVVPIDAASSPHGVRADAVEGPRHLFRTSTGVVIDLLLSRAAADASDRLAAFRSVGHPGVSRRTFDRWRSGSVDPDGTARRSPGDVELALRFEVVEAYYAIRSERRVATAALRGAEREALRRDAMEAARVRAEGKLN